MASKIGSQELLMNTAKQTHEVTDRGPHAFHGVDMDFAQAIAIIIARPFFESMTYRAVRTVHLVVTLPFIGIDLAATLRKVFHMGTQRLAVGVFDHAFGGTPRLRSPRAALADSGQAAYHG